MGDRVGEEPERRGEQVHVEMLSVAGAEPVHQRRVDGAEREIRRRHVGDRAARPRRRMARHAGDAHEPAHALRDRVVAGSLRVGAGLAEAAHRHVDDPGIHGAHGLVPHAKAIGDAGHEVLDEHVRAGGEVAEQPRAVRLLEVERDPALVPVDGGEDGAHARAPRARAPLAEVVAALRALDLDHVRPQVGEQHRAVRAGDHAREIEDTDPREHARGSVAGGRRAHAVTPATGSPRSSR